MKNIPHLSPFTPILIRHYMSNWIQNYYNLQIVKILIQLQILINMNLINLK